jgi:hypothetical protein
MTEDSLRLILDKNPGMLNILLTGVLLPLGILWLTNRHNRMQRETEKSVKSKYKSKVNLWQQEKTVYSSLSKILFDIQQLHSSLSGTCINNDCITNSLLKFNESVSKYYGDISNNMLYLSSEVINLVFKFYNQMNKLKIELVEFNNRKAFDIAPVLVFYSSQILADTIIEIQEIFMKERSELKVRFDKKQQEMMRNCCGSPPPEALKKKYEQLKQSVN